MQGTETTGETANAIETTVSAIEDVTITTTASQATETLANGTLVIGIPGTSGTRETSPIVIVRGILETQGIGMFEVREMHAIPETEILATSGTHETSAMFAIKTEETQPSLEDQTRVQTHVQTDDLTLDPSEEIRHQRYQRQRL